MPPQAGGAGAGRVGVKERLSRPAGAAGEIVAALSPSVRSALEP